MGNIKGIVTYKLNNFLSRLKLHIAELSFSIFYITYTQPREDIFA